MKKKNQLEIFFYAQILAGKEKKIETKFFSKPYFSRPKIFFAKNIFWSWKIGFWEKFGLYFFSFAKIWGHKKKISNWFAFLEGEYPTSEQKFTTLTFQRKHLISLRFFCTPPPPPNELGFFFWKIKSWGEPPPPPRLGKKNTVWKLWTV